MATVINNPQPTEVSNGGSSFLFGVILLILAVIFLLYYGLPYLNAGLNRGTQVNVPDKVDVNVQQPQK